MYVYIFFNIQVNKGRRKQGVYYISGKTKFNIRLSFPKQMFIGWKSQRYSFKKFYVTPSGGQLVFTLFFFALFFVFVLF